MREMLLAATLTGLCTALGAVPFLFVKELPRRAYDGILGLGAGLMLAAATLGLLGEALHGLHGPAGLDWVQLGRIAAGFIAGVCVAAAVDRLVPHRHARGHHEHLGHAVGHDVHDRVQDAHRGYMVIGALSIHRIPEGLAIGAGFAALGGAALGLLLAVAIGAQNVCEGVVMGAPLRKAGVAPVHSVAVVALTGLAMPVAALFGWGLSTAAVRAMPFILAFAGGTLIYVTSNEIIPESHSHGFEGTASAGLGTGFLLTMLIQAVLHP